MLIDPFHPGWLHELTRSHADIPPEAQLLLLIDGAFVPGLFRKLGEYSQPVLLFESLPGCSEDTRDVSPFVVLFDPDNRALVRVLDACNGWPMVSAVATFENAAQLAVRLAAWCIVEVDGQRFNFRFPDTRRLPGIFDALTRQQRAEFVGGALAWHYIGRDGVWHRLPLEGGAVDVPVSEKAALDDDQFGRLVADSEADGMWLRLQDRGLVSPLLPSQRHTLLAHALLLAEAEGLDEMLRLRWCSDYIRAPDARDAQTMQGRFAAWTQENMRKDNEALPRTA